MGPPRKERIGPPREPEPRAPPKEIDISLPNNQRQHRTLYIQKDVLRSAFSSYCAPCQPLLQAFPGWIRSPPPSGWV